MKFDLSAAEGKDAELRLLTWTGVETANIHLASGDVVPPVRDDLDRRKRGWLQDAVTRLARATRGDHSAWCKTSGGTAR